MQAVKETVDQWLQQMSLDWDTPLSLDEEGTCSIRSDNGYILELFTVEATSSCCFSIPLMDVPHENREAFYATILAVNVHQQETCGCTLAVDPESQDLLLCYSQPVASLTAEFFANLIQNLISTAASLIQKIESRLADHSPSQALPPQSVATEAQAPDENSYQPPPQHQFGHFMSLV